MNSPGSDERNGLYFGSASFVGEGFRSGLFDETTTSEARALELGWAAGCPIPKQLIESDAPGRGPEAMEARYGEVAFWHGQILDMAAEKNPDLHDRLTLPYPRYTGEAPVKYERESVPDSYEDEMSPMNTLWGYAIPRVLIEQFKGNGTVSSDNMEAAQDRFVKGLEILEEVIQTSHTPLDLMVNLSERVVQADADPKKVLHHVLSQGKFDEENSPNMWEFTTTYIRERAPHLREVYDSLNSDQKRELDIYEISSGEQ